MSDIREAFEALGELQGIAQGTDSDPAHIEQLALVIDAAITAALQSQTAPAVPEGWMLVPVEPTERMTDAGTCAASIDISERDADCVYAVMLDAAPQPAHSPGGTVTDYGTKSAPAADAGKVVQEEATSGVTKAEIWSGPLSRIEAIKILDRATDRDDPYWEGVVEDFYDESSDTMPTIFHVFDALGVTEHEYQKATGAENIKWPASAPAADGGEVEPVDGLSELIKWCRKIGYPMVSKDCAEIVENMQDALRRVQEFHPTQPRNEVQAEALEEYAKALDQVFASAQEANANNCPAWHAGQFAKDARKFADRLRSNGGDV